MRANRRMIKAHPPTMIQRTERGPRLWAALVSLRIATSTDVHRIQEKEAVRKKLIYKVHDEFTPCTRVMAFTYLINITWFCLNVVADHCQYNGNRENSTHSVFVGGRFDEEEDNSKEQSCF